MQRPSAGATPPASPVPRLLRRGLCPHLRWPPSLASQGGYAPRRAGSPRPFGAGLVSPHRLRDGPPEYRIAAGAAPRLRTLFSLRCNNMVYDFALLTNPGSRAGGDARPEGRDFVPHWRGAPYTFASKRASPPRGRGCPNIRASPP